MQGHFLLLTLLFLSEAGLSLAQCMCVCVCVCVCVCLCIWSGREEAASRKTCYFAWLFISHFS